MDITTSTHGSATVLHVAGRLTMVAAPTLRAAVDAQVSEGRARLVVDLAAVEFVDSSGLGALVSGLRAARQGGGDLRIAGAGEQVRTVLRLTNLDRVLRNHDSVADAAHGW